MGAETEEETLPGWLTQWQQGQPDGALLRLVGTIVNGGRGYGEAVIELAQVASHQDGVFIRFVREHQWTTLRLLGKLLDFRRPEVCGGCLVSPDRVDGTFGVRLAGSIWMC